MKKLIELLETNIKLKTDRQFLELLYNKNGSLATDKMRAINSAFKYKKKLGLSVKRRDYSNTYDVKIT